MTTLDTLVETPPVDLDGFIEESEAVFVSSTPSNINLAAHTAVLSEDPEGIATSFQSIVGDLESGVPSSKTADDIMAQTKLRTDKVTRQVVIDTMIDPTLSDAEKQSVVDSYQAGFAEAASVRTIAATESLVAPSEGETAEAEFVRVSMSGAVQEVMDSNRQIQQMLNATVAKTNTSSLDAMADMSELLLPFVEPTRANAIAQRLREGDSSAFDEAVLLAGNNKAAVRDAIANAAPADRMKIAQVVINAVNANAGVALTDNNDYARVNFLRSFLEEGYYTDVDQFVDNVVTLLDGTLFLGVLGRGVRTLTKASNVNRDAVRSAVQPTSLSNTIKDFNPGKYKALQDMANSSEEAAQAVSGTNRTEAVVGPILPEIGRVDGSVNAKVAKPESMLDQRQAPDADMIDFLEHVAGGGAPQYWREEKLALRGRVVNDFHNAKGLQSRTEMTQMEEIGTGLRLRTFYGPAQGGASNPQSALDKVRLALRDYAVEEDALTLMRRDGNEYVPTSIEELKALEEVKLAVDKTGKSPFVGKDGSPITMQKVVPDYLVRVDHEYKFNPFELDDMKTADVKHNIFDRVPMFTGKSWGSIHRHIFDAASTLHPKIVSGASIATDRGASIEKKMLELSKPFVDTYVKLPAARQQLLERNIKRANADGIDLDYNTMKAQGMTETEMEALKSWRKYWDTMYWVENADMVRSLKTKGFKLFLDEANDVRLVAKPVHKMKVGKGVKVYDPATDTVKPLNKTEIDELYEQGGNVSQLRTPIQAGEELAEFVRVENGVGKSMMRAMADNEQVLNYRKGYYPVHYKDPHFIIKVTRTADGNVHQRAVATAGTARDADRVVDDLSRQDGGEYFKRGDIKNNDDIWDLQVSGGRSAQRVRGQRLEEATSSTIDPTMENILDPIDSMIVAARSTSNRVSMREYMETTKRRFVQQYGHLFKEDKFGNPTFPRTLDDMKPEIRTNDKDIADARTTFEYINYLENGYRNAVDDSYKAVLNAAANIAGDSKLPLIHLAEKPTRFMANTKGPIGMGKSIAFHLYLALNPLRQFIVQSHQAVQLAANFPTYFAKRMAPDTSLMTTIALGKMPNKAMLKLAGRTQDEAMLMYKQFDESGLAANIDRQNLVSGSLTEIASMSLFKGKLAPVGKVTHQLSKPLDYSRKIGFDAGETVNMMTSWLAYRNKAIEQGKELTDDVLAEISGQARNYTGNMNFAGDMPYNQNALAGVMQFMQVPHKMLLTSFTNRQLSIAERSRLFGFNAVMYTLPPAFMYEFFGDRLPDDPALRDGIVQGLEGALLNSLLTAATGEKQSLDFSNLSPVDMFGTAELVYSILTTDLGTILASTPSGQLFFGNNPRVTNWGKSVARYMNVIDDYETPTELMDVAVQFASMASGFSNAFKANYLFEVGKKVNSTGGVVDSNVTSLEALAKALGFNSLDDAKRYYISDKSYRLSKERKDDFNAWYKETKKHLSRQGIQNDEFDFTVKMLSEFHRGHSGDPVALQMMRSNLKRDVQNGDDRMFRNALRDMSHGKKEAMKIINALPENQRDPLLETMRNIEALGENK